MKISQVTFHEFLCCIFCNRLYLDASFKEFCGFTELSGTAHMHKIKHVLKMSWDQISLPYHILLKIDTQCDLQMCIRRVQ